MAVLTIEGIVENGQIRLRDNVRLPEHARVYVIVPEIGTQPPVHLRSPHLAQREQAQDFAKEITEMRADADV